MTEYSESLICCPIRILCKWCKALGGIHLIIFWSWTHRTSLSDWFNGLGMCHKHLYWLVGMGQLKNHVHFHVHTLYMEEPLGSWHTFGGRPHESCAPSYPHTL